MQKKTLRLFSLYYFICYFTFAIASVQRIPYLKSIGYSSKERSLILSVIALVSIISQLIFGYISDKHHILKKLVLIVLGFYSVFSFFVYSFTKQVFIYHFIFLVLSGTTQNIITDLGDGWAMQSGQETRDNFSSIKRFQSFGYALGALLGSSLIASLGYTSLATLIAVLSVLALILASFISDIEKNETVSTLSLKDALTLLKSKPYFISILLFMTYFTIVQIHAISVAEKILYLGGNEKHVAMRVIVAVGLEGISYSFGDRLYRKIGPYKMLLTSSLSYIIMYVLFLIAQTPSQMIFFAALQILTVPFYVISMKHIVFNLSPNHLKTSGQLFMTALLVGISGTLTPLIVGVISENFGINAPLLFAIFMAMLSIIMVMILKHTLNGEQLHEKT